MKGKSILGRGLSSLLQDTAPVDNNINNTTRKVDINMIRTNPNQHRKSFDEKKIQELANSILEYGLLHPLLVSYNKSSGLFDLIAGERRLRACKIAKIKNIPVILHDNNKKKNLQISLIENIQRENITVMEEANAVAQLYKEYNYTQSDLSKILGKSRSHIANLLRLSQLPSNVQYKIEEKKINMGHARCLIGVENPLELIEKISKNNFTVRQTEELVKNTNLIKNNTSKSKKQTLKKNDDIECIAELLSNKLGTKVSITHDGTKGKIVVFYESIEKLDDILANITK